VGLQETASCIEKPSVHIVHAASTEDEKFSDVGVKESECRKKTTYAPSFTLGLPDSEPNFSAMRVSSLYGMNFATARNVCVRPDHSKTMFLYTQDDTLSLNLEERSGFNFGWNFEFVKSLIPPEATRVSGTTVVI